MGVRAALIAERILAALAGWAPRASAGRKV
jgi:hypothetical protein